MHAEDSLVVTGEKNSPLQPMKVVKGDQNVYPSLGVKVGYPATGL
jgi:hypothetical protein